MVIAAMIALTRSQRPGENLLGHHAVNPLVDHVDAVIGDRVHDPAVRDDASDSRPVLGDDKGSDPFFAHTVDGFGDGGVGHDGVNFSAPARIDSMFTKTPLIAPYLDTWPSGAWLVQV